MGRRAGLWRRWKRLAHRAAEIQSHVLLFVVYFVVVVPIGALRRIGADPLGRRTPPVWRHRPAADDDLAAAGRQF